VFSMTDRRPVVPYLYTGCEVIVMRVCVSDSVLSAARWRLTCLGLCHLRNVSPMKNPPGEKYRRPHKYSLHYRKSLSRPTIYGQKSVPLARPPSGRIFARKLSAGGYFSGNGSDPIMGHLQAVMIRNRLYRAADAAAKFWRIAAGSAARLQRQKTMAEQSSRSSSKVREKRASQTRGVQRARSS